MASWRAVEAAMSVMLCHTALQLLQHLQPSPTCSLWSGWINLCDVVSLCSFGAYGAAAAVLYYLYCRIELTVSGWRLRTSHTLTHTHTDTHTQPAG